MGFRIAGLPRGVRVSVEDFTAGGTPPVDGSVATNRTPATVTGIPRLNKLQYRGDTLTFDDGGITNITSIEWRNADTKAVASTSGSTSLVNFGGQVFEIAVVGDFGTDIQQEFVSPRFEVYTNLMMGVPMPTGHTTDDRAIIALVPQSEATHIMINDGDWSDSASWLNGEVPGNGAKVLVENGVSGNYDNQTPNIRLSSLRVDGDLDWDLTVSTEMIVEDFVVTRMGNVQIGTGSDNRVPSNIEHKIWISGKDYGSSSVYFTNLREDNFLETRGWGRGIVAQGGFRVWGDERVSWLTFAPVASGVNSITAMTPVTGLKVGDQLVLGGTDLTYRYYTNAPSAPVWEDEVVTITAINGQIIDFSETTQFPHQNQLSTSSRTDLYPKAVVRNAKNVVFESEAKNLSHQRGHFSCMHMFSEPDIWYAASISMGRTDKSIPAGIIDSDGDFATRVVQAGTSVPLDIKETLTSASNIRSRYSWHFHMLGYNHMGAVPIIAFSYMEDARGWGYVHHDCEMRMNGNSGYRWWGCAMVSESGSEVGEWNDNCMMGSYYESREIPTIAGFFKDLKNGPKNLAGPEANSGDTFREGYAYGFRGRAMRTNRNIGVSSTFPFVLYHRFDQDGFIESPVNLNRDTVDIGSTSLTEYPNSIKENDNDFQFFDYPIIHFEKNESIACIGGMFVSKEVHTVNNDVNVRLIDHLTWGCMINGGEVEYIGVYIIYGFDAVSSNRYRKTGNAGFRVGANNFQTFVVNQRSEGFTDAVYVNPQDTPNIHDDFDDDNPRWGLIGTDNVDCTNKHRWGPNPETRAKTPQSVTFIRDDWDGSFIDYSERPTNTLPVVMGALGQWANRANNSDGSKGDSVSSNADIYFRPNNDSPYFTNSARATTYINGDGYRTVSSPGQSYDGMEALVHSVPYSHRVTGRLGKKTHLIDLDGFTAGRTDRGTYTLGVTSVSKTDMHVATPVNTALTIDLVTGATGPSGIKIHTDKDLNMLNADFVKPNHGRITFNGATGEAVYTPDIGFVGVDQFIYPLVADGQFDMPMVTVLVGGTNAAVSTPVETTNFTVQGGVGQYSITLTEQPDTDNREIRTVFFSDDDGATWRRLCHKWVKATHVVTTTSAGAALTTGSRNIRVRYVTNHDISVSTGSVAEPVTIS